jgi:hypothetical protein
MPASAMILAHSDRIIQFDEWEPILGQKDPPASSLFQELEILQPSSPLIGDEVIDQSQTISHVFHEKGLLDGLDNETENGQFHMIKRNLLSDFDELEDRSI